MKRNKGEEIEQDINEQCICTDDNHSLRCRIIQNTVQCIAVKYSTVQYSTVQYSTVQYSTAQYSTAQHSTAQKSTYYLADGSAYRDYGTPFVKVRESALFDRPLVPVLQRVNDDDQIVVSVGPSVQSNIKRLRRGKEYIVR